MAVAYTGNVRSNDFFFHLSSTPLIRYFNTMEQKYAGEPIQESRNNPSHHRRSHSETFLSLPDGFSLDDLSLDTFHSAQPINHVSYFQSQSVDADFFEGLEFEEPPVTEAVERSARHRRSNSVDGYSSASSFEVYPSEKKAMAADRFAEVALVDPKRAKRILANRLSAARSKERKIRYTNELGSKVQTLQSEATTLSDRITQLQREATGLAAENRELKLKLHALEQQAHLREALSQALREELQQLKITASQIQGTNGN